MRITAGLVVGSVLAMLPVQAGPANASQAKALEIIGKQPLGFEQNRGQAREDVDYIAATGSGNVYLKSTGSILLLSGRDPSQATELAIEFGDANPLAKGKLESPIPGFTSSYFIGNDPSKWITGLKKYKTASYHQIWPGIDVVYYGNGSRLEYDFVVAPGSSPAAIRLRFSGMDSLRLNSKGDLELSTSAGVVTQPIPEIYQIIHGNRRSVKGHYVLSGNEARFQVASYDRTQPLVIDPVLVYSSINSSSTLFTVQGNGVTVDSTGRAYVVGISVPRSPAAGANAVYNLFLWVFDNAGNELYYQLWGGNGHTFGNALALDSNLNVYVAGSTFATDLISAGGFQSHNGGNFDGFFTKFALQNGSAGSISYAPVYSTYIGGAGNDSANALVVDSTGKAYVAGTTSSSNFPTTTGPAYRATSSSAFLVKIDPSIQSGAGSLLYSTLIGGTGTDTGASVAVDASFNAYVAGSTTSPTAPPPGFLPVASTGFAASKLNTNSDGFIIKLNATGTAATNLTFFSNGPINGIALGSDNSVYATGQTFGGIPVNSAVAGYLTAAQGGQDAFLAKFDATLSTLAYSSYLGGTGVDVGNSVAVDANGNAVIVGQTYSANFPSTTTALLGSGTDNLPDAFIARIKTSSSGSASLTFAATMGGDGSDVANSLALDGQGNIYTTGDTTSTNFPPATGQTSTTRGFVAKINPNPEAVSVTPSSGSGSSQTFQFLALDPAGAADLQTVWIWFTPSFSNSSANSCLLYYNQANHLINLLNDAGNSWMSMTAGNTGTLQNSQCSLNTGTMTIAPSSNNLTLSLSLTFNAAYAGGRQVWMFAAGANGNSGWQQRGTWTATAPPVPIVSAVSVTPNTGSGSSQIFQFLASDSLGATDLQTVWMWFKPSFSGSSANSCLLYYNQTTNQIYLLNDAGNSWIAMTPGTAGPMQNSQCSLNTGAMTVAPSGSNMTLSLPMSFKAPYTANQQVWMYASGTSASSGWQQKGTWTVTATAAPVVGAVSVTPNTGSGSTQTFQFLASDSNGATDLQTVWMWFTPAFGNSSANSCLLYYTRSTNVMNLLNDAGNTWMPMTVGTAGVLQNSQCGVDVSTVAITPSGNNLTVSLPISFKAPYTGNQQVWMYAAAASANSGWQQRGTWTATAPVATVSAVSVTPNIGSGSSQTFQFLFSDANGATDLNQLWIWITPAFGNSSANSCLLYYTRATNALNLLNDAGNTWMPMTVGTAGVLQNSQCSLNVATTTATPSGNNLTLSIPVSFKAAYAGNQQVWMYAGGSSANSGWQQKGTWTATAPSAPVVSAVSVTPNTGAGLTQTFQFLASDSNGSTDLTQVWMWFTAAFSNSSANSCLLYYSQTSNQVYLLNDASNTWMTATPGAAVVLQNSQCSLNVGAMTLAPSGTNLTVSMPMTFKAAYTGGKQVWMYAGGGAGNSGWQQRGSWTVQ